MKIERQAFFLQGNFMSSSKVNELVSYLKKNIPRLDILINNAAQALARQNNFSAINFKINKKKRNII